MYYSEYSPNPQKESPFEIENPASGPPDLNKVGIRTFGCPAQFKGAGLERDSHDDKGKLRNPEQTKLPSTVIVQVKKEWRREFTKISNRTTKVPFQNAEYTQLSSLSHVLNKLT